MVVQFVYMAVKYGHLEILLIWTVTVNHIS